MSKAGAQAGSEHKEPVDRKSGLQTAFSKLHLVLLLPLAHALASMSQAAPRAFRLMALAKIL